MKPLKAVKRHKTLSHNKLMLRFRKATIKLPHLQNRFKTRLQRQMKKQKNITKQLKRKLQIKL